MTDRVRRAKGGQMSLTVSSPRLERIPVDWSIAVVGEVVGAFVSREGVE
jgi:hypothetical protein